LRHEVDDERVMGGERYDSDVAMTSDEARNGEGGRKRGDRVGVNQYSRSAMIVISGNPNLTADTLVKKGHV